MRSVENILKKILCVLNLHIDFILFCLTKALKDFLFALYITNNMSDSIYISLFVFVFVFLYFLLTACICVRNYSRMKNSINKILENRSL